MIRKQPKLKTESESQFFARIACLLLLGLVHGVACFIFPLNHPVWLVVKTIAISFGPTAILLGAWAATGMSDRNLVYGMIAVSCMLMSYCIFLIGIRMAGLQFTTSSRASNLSAVDGARQSS